MRKVLILAALASLLGLFGCGGASSDTANAVSPTAKRYPFKGKIVSVDRAAKKASIDHEAIEGYMSAMTMDFPIHADWAWDSIKPGAEITGELVVDNKAKEPYFLENIVIISAADPNAPARDPQFAQIGQPAPDFTLTNQDAKKITEISAMPLGRSPPTRNCVTSSGCLRSLSIRRMTRPRSSAPTASRIWATIRTRNSMSGSLRSGPMPR